MAFVENLELKQFRNFSTLSINFSKGVNVFVGENGQGKTNLLESIYLLTKGRSFRSSKNQSLISHQEESAPASLAGVRASIFLGELDNQLNLNLTPSSKKFTMNSKRVSTSQLHRKLPSVLFSPESLAAIKEGPDQRRQLVDDLLETHSQRSVELLAEYKKCLRSRNRVFRDCKRERRTKGEAYRVIESLNDSFLRLATDLTATRIEALREISPDLSTTMRNISDEKDESVGVKVEYLVSDKPAMTWNREQIFSALCTRLEELQKAEFESGTSLIGPHKHDINFLYAGNDSRYYCSQGQQRALILSFKMAQILYHYKVHQQYPILLLDDVMSELDRKKRENLVKFLRGINSQIFLTTTELDVPEDSLGENLSLFQVKDGRVWS